MNWMKKILQKKREMQKKVERILLFLLLILILAGSSLVFGKPKTAKKQEKAFFYVSVAIQRGDTIWDLSEEYCPSGWKVREFMEEVMRLNGIYHGKILPGQHILIPVYSK